MGYSGRVTGTVRLGPLRQRRHEDQDDLPILEDLLLDVGERR